MTSVKLEKTVYWLFAGEKVMKIIFKIQQYYPEIQLLKRAQNEERREPDWSGQADFHRIVKCDFWWGISFVVLLLASWILAVNAGSQLWIADFHARLPSLNVCLDVHESAAFFFHLSCILENELAHSRIFSSQMFWNLTFRECFFLHVAHSDAFMQI